MALTLDQLVKMTNMAPDVKQNAINNIAGMNESQRFELSQICWENIASQYDNKSTLERDRMLEEMATGEKNYGPDDFAQIDEKIISDLLLRIDMTKTKEELTEIRENLKQYTKAPLPQNN